MGLLDVSAEHHSVSARLCCAADQIVVLALHVLRAVRSQLYAHARAFYFYEHVALGLARTCVFR